MFLETKWLSLLINQKLLNISSPGLKFCLHNFNYMALPMCNLSLLNGLNETENTVPIT